MKKIRKKFRKQLKSFGLKSFRLKSTVAVSAALLMLVSGCGAAGESTAEASADGVKKVIVGYSETGYPLSYQDEDGNFTGYELEILKAVDERLDEYEFEYVPGAQDALYAGLSTGRYDIVVTNAFYTEERAKAYILPENHLGASLVGMILKKDVSGIDTFEDAATADLSLAPILAGDGLYYVVAQYNEENPDNQIELSATDSASSFMDAVGWISEGRYDFAAWPKNYWEQVVAAEDGELHEYYDDLQFIECRSVYTYPVIAKGEDELASKINMILGELAEEGRMVELSNEFYGYNAFAYEVE